MGFPKYVFKRGTGTKVSEGGLFTAESALVTSAEDLAVLGAGWCDSPSEAAEAKPEAKHEAKPETKPDAKPEAKHDERRSKRQ